uniref:Uncharacterized protein n=1 Tax=Oryza sativa subsp. japonica TaxID=39947 RepID=Q6ETP9_ORYSJ|nr:hypothetical protein [Oryza sativa Japonica Group]
MQNSHLLVALFLPFCLPWFSCLSGRLSTAAMRKIRLTGSEPSLKRRGFFRYRRLPVEAQSLSTAADDKSLRLHGGQLRNYSSTSMSNESLVPNHNIGLLGRIQQLIDSHQSRRCRTAAFDVLRKVLKHA